MSDINQILETFSPIILKEMESVKLLNRVDTKYLLPIEKIPGILEELKNDYRVLEIDQVRNCHYKTIYYDTADFRLYLQHHNGRLNRYKIRFRRYEDSDVNFFELKFKNNKKRTIKERINCKKFNVNISGKKKDFLTTKTSFNVDEFEPVITITYSRITLVSNSMNERLTIDTELAFENDSDKKSYKNMVIIETKQGGNIRSKAIEALHKYHVHDFSLSKYCLGINSLYPEVKNNNFKSKFKAINKICHENT